MNRPLRVLVVEALAHILPQDEGIATCIDKDTQFELIGRACELTLALRSATRQAPDLIVLDCATPRIDAAEFVRAMMSSCPVPIVAVASVAGTDFTHAKETTAALNAGAVCIAPRPLFQGVGKDESLRQFKATLVNMAQVKVVRQWPQRPTPQLALKKKSPLALNEPAKTGRTGNVTISHNAHGLRLITIASSTGGPAALHRILASLPADYSLPIAVTQHMTEGFVDGLAEWLGSVCSLKVKVAESGEPFEPHTVYIAPDGAHLGVEAGVSGGGTLRVFLSTTPAVRGFRPSGTFLFECAARVLGKAAAGIILTGMGEDGVDGLRVLHAAGATTIAQDEASSVVFGMPRAAVEAGVVTRVLPLPEIALRLQSMLL